jgi:hypothetical protein
VATRIWIGTDSGNEGDWETAANWTGAAVPIGDDDVYFEDSSQSVTANLDQSAVELDSLNIAQSYTGSIGDDDTALEIDSPIVNIGYNYGPGSPLGSPLINLLLDAVASVITVFNTGSSAIPTQTPVRISANSASTTLEVRKGKVSIALGTSETTTIGAITAGYTTNKATDTDIFIGKGVTLTDLILNGGEVSCIAEGAAKMIDGTLTVNDGVLTTEGLGTMDAMIVNGGTAKINSTGTITSLILNAGTTDTTGNAGTPTLTVSALQLNNGATLKHDPVHTVFTAWTEPSGAVSLRASLV